MRLIDADALMKHIKDVPTWQDCDEYLWKATNYPHGMYNPEDIVSSIENTPAIDAVEVVHGRWVYKKTHQGMKYVCSECGEIPECFEPNYCPNCGATMDGDMTQTLLRKLEGE